MATEYKLSYTASEIDENLKKIDELPIENGTGEYSIVVGNGGTAIGNNSAVFGIDNIAGCKGYYIKSIDITNKKIYLGTEQVLPVISEADNTDTSFETPAYEVGDLFNISNQEFWVRCASIVSMANNVISYDVELPFTEIKNSDYPDGNYDVEEYTFSVMTKPLVGLVSIQTTSFAHGINSIAAGTGSTATGLNSVAWKYGNANGYETIAGYASHTEGKWTKANRYGHAEGLNTTAWAHASHAEGRDTIASGIQSHAEGDTTIASGQQAHAEGQSTEASGNYSHAEGLRSKSQSSSSHSEGRDTIASGENSHSEGRETTASGGNAHAEGRGTIASGNHSHAEGYTTESSNTASHAEGRQTIASGLYAHAEGYITSANGTSSHVEGENTIANGRSQHVQGKYNIEDTEEKFAHIVGNGDKNTRSNAHTLDWNGNGWFAGGITAPSYIDMNRKEGTKVGKYSSALGYNVEASYYYSHAEGYLTQASDWAAHAEGDQTKATNNYSHAEGYCTRAEGQASHAEGHTAQAKGNQSHAEGYITDANGGSSHAEGSSTKANGDSSHAEGSGSKSIGNASHAEGSGSESQGQGSHAEGYYTFAIGKYSHTEGNQTYAQATFQHVQGKHNIKDSVDDNGNGNYAHIVGNGIYDNRSNAHTLDWQGNAWYQGSVTSNGADYAEYFEWMDGNLDNEDRVGLLVTLNGEKIKLANNGDEILGIISGTAAVLGDNYECEWNGKYLTDDFGRVIYDLVEEFVDIEHIELKEVEKEIIDEETNETRTEFELEEVKTTEKQSLGLWKHPRLNPDYDPEQTYVNRSNRPEWDTVGMLGKLYVRDDGTCEVNGYATVGENGIATKSDVKTNMRVLSRVNENVVRVLLK